MTEIPEKHFNELTPAEDERLALLSEELGEAVQAIGKIFRHGYESYHPDKNPACTNRKDLERELGHVIYAINLMMDTRDLSGHQITRSEKLKAQDVGKYLHHN